MNYIQDLIITYTGKESVKRIHIFLYMGFPGSSVAMSYCKATELLQCRRSWFNSWVGNIPWRKDRLPTPVFIGFPGGSDGKESTCNVGYSSSTRGLGRSTGEGIAYPLQCSWASLVT